MSGVNAALDCLGVIAVLNVPRDVPMALWHSHPLELRQLRLQLARTHVGEQNSCRLLDRVRRYLDLVLEDAVFILRGHVDAVTFNVELPAMVCAAQTAFLIAAEE